VGVILELLEALDRVGYASPGDVVVATGKPRYLVLSALKLLEELGFVEPIYSRGTHKIYRVSRLGRFVMEVGLDELRRVVEAELEVREGHGGDAGNTVEATSSHTQEAPASRATEISQEA